MASNCESVTASLRSWARGFDTVLEAWLPNAEDGQSELIEAMRYSALSPGKRLRPFLTIRCCELAGGQESDAYPAAVAVECVHAFSLIHDDLPAMDDDAVRRGRPANHVVYGQGMAVLAGDALLNYAYEVLANRLEDPQKAAASIRELARAVGADGMIGGQASDILGENLEPTESLVSYIHIRKTSRLFEASCRLGGIAAAASAEVLSQLGTYGRHLGLAFQMADDLLDAPATDGITGGITGESVSKDVAAGKQTGPALLGVDRTRKAARRQIESAIDALSGWDASADDLRQLSWFVIERSQGKPN